MNFLADHFTPHEIACHCGDADCQKSETIIAELPHFGLDPRIAGAVADIRAAIQMPLVITSAHRCPQHPIAKSKKKIGAHGVGMAVDMHCADHNAVNHSILLQEICARFGTGQNIKGVGLSEGFFHADCGHPHAARPACGVCWFYG